MEKRAYARYPGHIKVLLYHDTLPVAVCSSENAGPDGMYVQSKSAVFDKDTQIEIEFEDTAHVDHNRYRIPATIVFTDQYGMGIRFIPSALFAHRVSRMMLGSVLLEEASALAPREVRNSKEVA
ncbi:MAG: hypothetical protein PVG89_06640 [Gammaproteobacteria bacterium]|jgi:hypothetical protein